MTDIDIDAIRSILTALDGRPLDRRPALAARLAGLAPALCDEVEQLRTRLADRNASLDRVIAERDAARTQANRLHEQNAAAQNALRSLGQAYADLKTDNDELAAENARALALIEAVKGYIGEDGEGESDTWSARELLAGRPTLEYPQGVAR